MIYRTPKFREIKVKNSPLWTQAADQQLWYYGTRSWARRFVPDVLLGIYSRDELEDEGDHTGPDKAKDVTPKPALAERLKGNKGRGFDAKHVEITVSQSAESAAGEPKAGDGSTPPSPAGGEPEFSAADAYALGAECRQKGGVMTDCPRQLEPAHKDAWKADFKDEDEKSKADSAAA